MTLLSRKGEYTLHRQKIQTASARDTSLTSSGESGAATPISARGHLRHSQVGTLSQTVPAMLFFGAEKRIRIPNQAITHAILNMENVDMAKQSGRGSGLTRSGSRVEASTAAKESAFTHGHVKHQVWAGCDIVKWALT